MSAEVLLDALEGFKLRPAGADRWRAICPVCGERNPNTLSVGVTSDGKVLLKCFKSGCSAPGICAAIGLDIDDLFPPREHHGPPLKRRRLLGAGQALQLLHDEALLVAVCAANIAHGVALADADRARCLTAVARIGVLLEEACA